MARLQLLFVVALIAIALHAIDAKYSDSMAIHGKGDMHFNDGVIIFRKVRLLPFGQFLKFHKLRQTLLILIFICFYRS